MPLAAKMCSSLVYLLAWFVARNRFPSTAVGHVVEVKASDDDRMKVAVTEDNVDEDHVIQKKQIEKETRC